MTFRDLSRIIRKQSNGISSAQPLTPEQIELEESRALLQQLHENHIRAYNKRKEEWFQEHPGEKYLNETYEDFVKDCEADEWYWYFIERITSRTPEQWYQDEMNPDYGWNHLSKVHSIDEPCKEGCRFWPETGRIEDVEILEDYKEFQGYDKVRKIWDSLMQLH